jgi:hypothetical protein
MPTGYTTNVQEGKVVELKDYILDCSRNFGALIHMRDDSNNTEIRYREVSDYHLKQLERAKNNYEEFKKLTDEEIQLKLDESYNQNLKDKKESLKRFEEGKQRYLDMLDKVKGWQPPSEEHINLKNFAIKQLEESLDFDYSDRTKEYYLQEPFKDTIEGYKQYKIKSYLKDIEYHSKGYREEIEGVEKVNKWIDDLINSFK